MSRHYPFCLSTLPTVCAVSLALLMPAAVSPLLAQTAPQQTAQQAALSDNAKSGRTSAEQKPAAESAAPQAAPAVAANPAAQKGITGKAIDKVKEVAKSAGDIFSRVPCLPPKGGSKSMGSLPHVASKLVAGEPVVIVAFGSSSTAGLRRDRAGIHLSQPARRAIAPAISDRRHHRHQCRQGRRGRARNDEAAADRRHRHAAGSGDLAGRHQRRAAQPRSGRDRKTRRGRHRAHSGGGRRRRADRSAIFAARSTSTPKAPAR